MTRTHWALIATATLILTGLATTATTALINHQTSPNPATLGNAPHQPPQPDLNHLHTWWQTALSDQTRTHVTTLTYNGTTLTATTNLHPDNDAKQPAQTICQALTTYWHLNPPPHPIRVLDRNQQILTSNHTGRPGDCQWRR